MSEKKIEMGDVSVVIPDMVDNTEDTNNYIDTVLQNVDYSDTIYENEKTSQELLMGNKHTPNGLDVDDILSSDSKNAIIPKRTLNVIEKILFSILVVVPIIQMICMFAVKLDVYIICSVICFVVIALASFLLGQYSMVGVEIVLLAASVYMVHSGFSHGLNESHFEKKSLMEINMLNETTPTYVAYDGLTEEEIVNKFQGKLIYYYRYGCKDCSAIDEKFELFVKSSKYDVVAIETRTDFGKQMLDLYTVDEVPAGVVIMPDGTYRAAMLCKTENGKQDLDVQNLNYLFELLSENKQ